jgi:hypothetical protein
MESVLGIDVVNKAIEIAGELSGLRGSVQELIREDFKGFVESWLAETGENTTREILEKTVAFKYALAQYKLNNESLMRQRDYLMKRLWRVGRSATM